jgi:hypothetical protein
MGWRRLIPVLVPLVGVNCIFVELISISDG